MGDVIKFPDRRSRKREMQVEAMYVVSQHLDDLIKNSLVSGQVDTKEMAAILAHRLGHLLSHMSEDKTKLLEFCEGVVRNQAQ